MPDTNRPDLTHTPINLAPGIDLMVRADFVDEPETRSLVEHLVEHLNRDNRARDLRRLIDRALELDEDDAHGVLAHVLEMMGWLNNHKSRSARVLADAIDLLIPLASMVDLVQACDVADFEIAKLAEVKS